HLSHVSSCLSLVTFHIIAHPPLFSSFFFNDPSTTEIYTLSLHDALPISSSTMSWNRRSSSLSVASGICVHPLRGHGRFFRQAVEIGRASCRERVEISGGAG